MVYKFLEHTADVKFVAEGENLSEMFREAALATKETITKGVKINAIVEKKFTVEGTDYESLLYHFLEEFVYLLDAESFIIAEIKEIKITDLELEATIIGDDVSGYEITNDVKAITYNDMYVREIDDVWECQVVLDV